MEGNFIINIVRLHKRKQIIGIYSACSSNEFVIDAVLRRGKETNTCVLIESTANQCNQYGGYTGMTPDDFVKYVESHAEKIGFEKSKLLIGGDHLGPLIWADKSEQEAMEKAEQLIRDCVKAGYKKIHIDTSMRLVDDNPRKPLGDQIIIDRSIRLIKVAEEELKKIYIKDDKAIPLVYVIGSEVPIPGGGVASSQDNIQVTNVKDFDKTVRQYKQGFIDNGLDEAWSRVVAFVVQPGIEERDSGCIEYDNNKTQELKKAIDKYENIIFEGHSTDYQTKYKLKEMIEDGIAILKVGPALTFATREALFGMSLIENELCKLNGKQPSNLVETLVNEMFKNKKHWTEYYKGDTKELEFKFKYSFSDRSRYYMNTLKVEQSIKHLLENLEGCIPYSLLSQYFPQQYVKVRNNRLRNSALDIIYDYVGGVIDTYLYATNQNIDLKN